jgi:hypothetical protein
MTVWQRASIAESDFSNNLSGLAGGKILKYFLTLFGRVQQR